LVVGTDKVAMSIDVNGMYVYRTQSLQHSKSLRSKGWTSIKVGNYSSAATRHCKKHKDYQTLARIRMARAAPRKRLKVAELAPANEL